MSSANPNRLIVEGKKDLLAVAELMGAHVEWPDDRKRAPVWIHVGGSKDEILAAHYLPTVLKEPDVRRVGVLLDADDNAKGRYDRVRHLVRDYVLLPPRLHPNGVVVQAEGIRFGVWVMPNNRSRGILESFLAYLVPSERQPLWEHAQSSVASARTLGAGCREAHVEKAHLYTWLCLAGPARPVTQPRFDEEGARPPLASCRSIRRLVSGPVRNLA